MVAAGLEGGADPRCEVDGLLGRAGLGTWWWDPALGAVRGPQGEDLLEGSAPEDRRRVTSALEEALRLGWEVREQVAVPSGASGTRHVELRGGVGPRGGAPRLSGVTVDVTERHLMDSLRAEVLAGQQQARSDAEQASARLALLAEAGTQLAATVAPSELVERAAALVAERFGDWCVVELVAEDGALRLAAVAHRRPELVAALELAWSAELPLDGPWSSARVLERGRAERVDGLGPGVWASLVGGGPVRDAARTTSPSAVLVAPVRCRDGLLGVLTIARTEGGFAPDDLALAEDLGLRVGVALDSARLLASRTEVARALQQALLPPALPVVPGVELGARYEVADAGVEIGGDFFDVFATGDTWHVVVGDVCGKGPAAAAITGLFRHTVRAVAVASDGPPSPAAVLAQTSAAAGEQLDDSRFATAVMASVTCSPAGAVRATVACGGHPRPILVAPGRPPERLVVEGALLGVLADPGLRDVEVDLAAGALLVLHTDGVTEARAGSEELGEERVLAALDAARHAPSADAVAQAVLDAVERFRGFTAPVDDVAVVVLRVPLSGP